MELCSDDKSQTNKKEDENNTTPTLEKLQNAAPYNIFFSTIPESKATYSQPNSLTFSDLLCPSLGKLKCSLQISFFVDIIWLLKQYYVQKVHKKPLTLLYGGDSWSDNQEFMDKCLPNVKYHLVEMKDGFGCHHSKIGVYIYEDNSLRVVVSSANLYYSDWNNFVQTLWISPLCQRLPEGSVGLDSGESPTGFKKSLLDYLRTYKLDVLNEWVEYVENADFSDVRVFLVTSVPGVHYPDSVGSHLHRVADLLSRYCQLPVETRGEKNNSSDKKDEKKKEEEEDKVGGPLSWAILAQSSCIGDLGRGPQEWLVRCLLRSLSAHKDSPLDSDSKAPLKLIWPTMRNVFHGYLRWRSGGCLPYRKDVHERQEWVRSYLYHWKADKSERSRAMPHSKTYCRISPCNTKLAWFLLTSSNLSKNAWGNGLTSKMTTLVRSYEAGVLFLPEFFDKEYFEIENNSNSTNKKIQQNKKFFPFLYDLPLTEYKKQDYAYCY